MIPSIAGADHCALEPSPDDRAHNIHILIDYCVSNQIFAHGIMDESVWAETCDASDLDRYMTLCRGLIWKLIERFEIANAVDESQPSHVREVLGKDALKAWAGAIVALTDYKPTPEVKNFRGVWEDGVCFLALFNHIIVQAKAVERGFELIDMTLVDTSSEEAKMDNCRVAFDGIRGVLGVYRMLTPDLVVSNTTPNALKMKSVCSYLATVNSDTQSKGLPACKVTLGSTPLYRYTANSKRRLETGMGSPRASGSPLMPP